MSIPSLPPTSSEPTSGCTVHGPALSGTSPVIVRAPIPSALAAVADFGKAQAQQGEFCVLQPKEYGKVIFVRREYIVREENMDGNASGFVRVNLCGVSQEEQYIDTGYSDNAFVYFRLSTGVEARLPFNYLCIDSLKPGGKITIADGYHKAAQGCCTALKDCSEQDLTGEFLVEKIVEIGELSQPLSDDDISTKAIAGIVEILLHDSTPVDDQTIKEARKILEKDIRVLWMSLSLQAGNREVSWKKTFDEVLARIPELIQKYNLGKEKPNHDENNSA